MGAGEEEMVPVTPGSCGVGEAMPRAPLRTDGYSLDTQCCKKLSQNDLHGFGECSQLWL